MKRYTVRSMTALLLALVLCLTACGGSATGTAASSAPAVMSAPYKANGYKSETMSMDAAAAAPMEEMEYSAIASEEGVIPDTGNIADDRKIIYTGRMDLETKEFDSALTAITDLVSKSGGYISSQEIYGVSIDTQRYNERSARLTIRVPVENFDSLMAGVAGVCNVTERSLWTDDISDTYYDTQARLDTLSLQEERLLDILAKATRLEDIIVIEQELSQVRYEIESITARIRRMDNQVAYSTLDLSVREVIEYTDIEPTPISFGEEIAAAFSRMVDRVGRFFRNLILWIIEDLPLVILEWGLFIIAVSAVLWVLRKLRWLPKFNFFKRKKKEAAAPAPEENKN